MNFTTTTLSSVVRIQKARMALLLDHPFFGTLLFRLGARARSSIATMATDGVSLYFNPEFVESLNSAELIGTALSGISVISMRRLSTAH